MPPSAPGFHMQLPGRVEWVEVCHAEPAACPRCLEAVAAFLAQEMGWDMNAAIDRPAQSYAAEFSQDRCTLEQARELRRLTCQACLVHVYELAGTPVRSIRNFVVVADNDFAEAPSR